MSDYKNLIDALRAWHNSWFSPNVYENYSIFGRAANAIEQLQKERDAAVREVVRCSECKNLVVYNNDIYARCSKTGYEFMPFETDTRAHFCSYGEREGKK